LAPEIANVENGPNPADDEEETADQRLHIQLDHKYGHLALIDLDREAQRRARRRR
jgi:hypothetical protein